MLRMSSHERKIEAFRSHYFLQTGKKLDDEILLILIKISEVHADLKRDNRKSRPQFSSGWDYFVYGMGTIVTATILACLFIALYLIIHH